MSGHVTKLENLPQSHEFSQFLLMCYIRYSAFITFGRWKP